MSFSALQRSSRPPFISCTSNDQAGSNQPQRVTRLYPGHVDAGRRKLITQPSRRSLLATPPLLCCGCGCGKNAAAASDKSHNRNALLDRVFAEAMFTGMEDYESAIVPVKTRLFSQLRPTEGREDPPLEVVEFGCGTGPNLPYYDKDRTTITAVDPNSYMLPYLQKNMVEQGWKADSISTVVGLAEALPLEDNSADAVVCTLVLCSVTDVAAAVVEAKRVLRPGGQLLFIEHTVAGNEAGVLLRVAQYALNPLQRVFADGCNLIRDPLPVIEDAGFESVDSMRFQVEGFNLIGPHVAGIAKKGV